MTRRFQSLAYALPVLIASPPPPRCECRARPANRITRVGGIELEAGLDLAQAPNIRCAAGSELIAHERRHGERDLLEIFAPAPRRDDNVGISQSALAPIFLGVQVVMIALIVRAVHRI